MTPTQLQETGSHHIVGGTVAAPDLPTCHGKVLDYFVVAASLRHAVVKVQRIEGAGVRPHWHSRLTIAANARRRLVRMFVRPPRIAGDVPFGPSGAASDCPAPRSDMLEGRDPGETAQLDGVAVDWLSLIHI